MPELNQIVSDRMRSVLVSQHLTFEAYAQRTNQNLQKVARRFRGEVPITVSDIDTFASATGYTPDEFLKDEFVLKPSSALAGKGVE